jgi:hypothetical protein
LLADDDIKQRIYEACENGETPMNLVMGTPMSGREERDHAITLTVYVLPPRKVSPDTSDDTVNNLWIIPVVDDRYYWQFRHTSDLASGLQFSEITTADALVEYMMDLTGVEYLNVKVNTAHTVLPSCRSRNDYENLPIVMDSIFAHTGQRLVVDIGSYNTVTGRYGEIVLTQPPGGTHRYALIDGLNSRYVFENALLGNIGLQQCVWAGGGTSLSTTASAANYIVGEPQLVAGGVSSAFGAGYTQYASAPSSVAIQTTSGLYITRTPSSEYVTTGNAASIWRTEFDEEPATAQADQLGRDYFYQFHRQFDFTFAGVQPWQQGYNDDYMVIRQTWNAKTKCYDAYTRVCSRQPNLTGEWTKEADGKFEAVLQEDLDAPASSLAEPTSANVYFMAPSEGALIVVDGLHECFNADPSLTGTRGTYCRVERINGQLKFYYMGCDSQPALVTAMEALEA